MRRLPRFVLPFFIFSVLLVNTALGQEVGTNHFRKAPDIQAIQERGVLRVAMTKDDQPPFYYKDADGKLKGLDVYLATRLAASLGVKPQFLRSFPTFDDVADAVASGKADVAISKLSRTLKRAQTLRFSTPYVVFHQALLLNRLQLAKVTTEDETANFVRNFRGKIGVIADSAYVSYAHANFPHGQVVGFPTWDELVSAVLSGQVLAAYRDELECRLIMEKRPQASLGLKLVILTDQTDPIAIASSWKNTQLAAFINIFLDTLDLHLDVAKILHQSFNQS